MNADRRLLHETAEVVLALMQGLAAFRDRHDLVHAALIAARQAPEAAGAPEHPNAPPDDEARVRECAARIATAFSGDPGWTMDCARAALAYADELHANAERRAANRIAGMEIGCAELRTELAKARARIADLEALNRGWQAKDGAGDPALPADLRDRLARLLVGRECVRSFTEDEGAVVNELIVWALKLPDAETIPDASSAADTQRERRLLGEWLDGFMIDKKYGTVSVRNLDFLKQMVVKTRYLLADQPQGRRDYLANLRAGHAP